MKPVQNRIFTLKMHCYQIYKYGKRLENVVSFYILFSLKLHSFCCRYYSSSPPFASTIVIYSSSSLDSLPPLKFCSAPSFRFAVETILQDLRFCHSSFDEDRDFLDVTPCIRGNCQLPTFQRNTVSSIFSVQQYKVSIPCGMLDPVQCWQYASLECWKLFTMQHI